MAKVTVRGGRKTYELTDAERRSLQIQMNQTYSEEDRQRIRYTAEDLDRSIVNSVNSNQYQDSQALSDTQRRLNAYQRSLRQLEALGYDMTGGMEHLRAMRTAANTQNRVHSSFGSQEEYDTARQYAADLEGLNLESAWDDLDALTQERDRIENLSPAELKAYVNANRGSLPGYVDGAWYDPNNILLDYDRRITERQQYLSQIERARSLEEMEAIAGHPDFAANSAYTGNRSAGSAEAYRLYRYINDPEYRKRYGEANDPDGAYSRTAAASAALSRPAEFESIDQMTEEEIAVFNSYYNTLGGEAAMKYFNALTPTIRQRRAAERFAELRGRTGAELAYGVAAGLDQFGSGLRGLVSREEQSPTWRQYASGMVRDDLQDNRMFRNSNAENSLGQVAYDAITSSANMLPSILASSLVGLINPGAGTVTGAALMGASASGNAYQEMLNLGYDKGQARAYSVLVGGSEAALSYLLGGITKLGGVLPKGVTNALIQNTDKAIARVAIQFLGSSISEFSEEYLQEVISAVLQNEILRAGNDLSKVTEDAIYSGLLGALTGGVLEGGGAITGAVQTRNTGKQFLESGAKLGDLQALAAMMPDVESVQNLSRRVNEDSNAYTVGRFYEEVTGAMSEQNKADLSAVRQDVLAELETAGITGKDANTIANAVEAKITGRELSTSQQRLIARVGEAVPRIGDIIDRGVNSDRVGDGIARSLLHSNITRDMTGQQTASDAPITAEQKTLPVTQTAQQNVSQTNSADTSTTIAEAAKNTGVTEAALSRIYKMGSENQSEEEFSAAAEEVVNFAEESSLPAEKVLDYVNTLSSVSVLTPSQRSALVDIGRDSIRLAYNIGYAGQNINDALENKRLSRYSKAEITAAYNRGADAAKAKTGSMPQATSEAKTRKKGTVRFDGDAQAFLRKFNKAQRSAYRIMSRLAEITGMNIVLYDSVADSQGRYAEVQGSFDPADPNTVRVDINAGLSGEADIGKLAEYTMLRTFTHEFVHSIEINAPKQYAKLKRVVFEQMRQNGKDVTELIEQKVVEYGTDENGNDILSYDDASHEVLAESLTEVLPQSTFIETLATKHRNIFDKIYEALKRFMALIKARFAEMNQGTMKAEAKALMQEMNGVMQYTQNIVDAFDKAALAAVETVQSRNMDSADAMNNTEAFKNSSVAIRNQIRPPYNENTKAFAEFADGLNAEARETFDLFYNFYNLSRITNTTNAAGKPVKAINISAPFLRVDEWNAKISSDAKWGAAAARLAEFLPDSVRENMHMNEDGSLTETPLEKEFKMQRSLAQRLVDSLPLEKIDAVYDIEGRRVELPAGKARQSVGGEAYRRAVIGEVRKLFHDGRLKQVSIGTLSKDRWGSLGFLAANGKTGASGDFTTICPQMMFNRGCFYCYRRAALESGVNNKLVAERVWYAGEILRIKQKDIDALNENGGLRIQSFGDWMPHFSAMLADVLHDAELRGLQVKIITKEPSMIQYLAALRDQGLGNNLYFNLSADYAIEKAPAAANTAGSASLDHINPDRPFMRDEDKQMWWKRAMTVEEAGSFRAKYPWVNTRIVATDTEEFIRGLKDPTVDVVTGYHGNIRNYERIDSETGARKVEVEALGDAGMPRFVYENGEWITEYEGKTSTHKQLAQRIREEGLFLEYYAKVCCQTGRCATCKGKCGQMARSLAMKNATNRDSKSRAYWQERMSSAVEDISEASPEVDALVAEFRQRMQNLSRNNENPTGKVRYQRRENADRTSPTEYAPVFYSKMAKVIEGMKQEKFGASSVVNMFRGKGVTSEEIKWSGIEAWLEGKKSVTKAELLEFIAGSALQIDEEVLTDEQTPYSEEQQRTLDSYNAQRENAVNNLAEAWRNRFGEQLPTRHEYYDFVRNRIEKSNEENAKASEEYKRYKDAERALRKVVDDNDYFGFDSLSEAMAVIRSDDGTFADYYEMSAEESEAFTRYFADREAYWNVPAFVSDEERRSLYRLAESVDEIGRDIARFKREHEKESERRKTKWGEYKIPGGTNYREVLFKIPNSTYWNDSTLMHWENRLGVFAHARVQDLNTAEGTMLFVEEIQSDWHNEGRKKGYETDRNSTAVIEERESLYKRHEDIWKEIRTADKDYEALFDDYWGSDMSEEEYQRTAERIREKQQRLKNSLDAVDQQIAELTRQIKEFVPDAPFRENYQEYVLKRLIREAAEKNYDSIGWTTADIQSRRWDSKYAEGYRIEYEQDIPKFLNKYGKKWGTKVARTALHNGTEIWTMPISESMKEAVLYEGQTRFQRRENLTDREVLERAAADVAQFGNLTEGEAYALEVFNKHLAKLKDLQAQRREQGRIFHDNTFEKGGDRNAAVEARNRMGVLDGQIQREVNSLLDLENKAVLQKVLQKARGIVEADVRERNRENLERYRDRQDNSAAIRKYRSRIMTDVETLNGWLMKPDNKSVVKHIPEALRGSVVPFLQSIDFTSKRQLSGGAATKADAEFVKRLNALRDVMKEYAPDANTYEGYADLPPDFMENLDKLVQASYDLTSSGGETFIINRMTSAELHDLSNLVRKVKKFVQDFNLFHNNAMFKHVYDAGDNSISTLSEMKDAGSEANKVNDFLQWKQILPAYAWERFGDGGESIFRELMRAQDQLGFNSKRIIEFSEKAFTRKEIDAWRKQIVPIKLKSGKTMSIPATYLMGLYELSKREAGRRHILGNGIKTGKWKAGENDGGKSFEIAQEDLDTMFKENLSERQRQVADALQTFMQSVCANWGNYVTMARFGEKQFGDPHYYPIVSDSNNRDAKSDEAPQATGLYRLLNMGFTKQLNEKANDKIMLFDIFDVFANHAADLAQYNAFALPVVDALKWFNYKQRDANGKIIDSVREEMDRVYGVPVLKDGKSGRGYAQAFVTGILQAINGTETQGSRNDAPAMKGLGLYNRAQVAYNFRVVIQQPTAIVRSALVLDPASVLRALTVKNIKKNMQEMQEYSGIAVWKDLGFYDVNISRNLTGMILQDKNFGDKFVDVGMAGAEAADKLTWSWIWAACKEEVIAKQNLKPGDDGFFAAVSAKFDEVIYKTQVVDSVLTKNAYMRDAGVVAKTLSSFMSESARNSSMLLDAAERIRRGLQSGMSKQEVWRKHGKHLSRAMIVYGIGAVLNAAAQSLPDAARDDDEYETLLEKYWEAFKSNVGENLNPLNLLPVISDVFEALKGLYAEVAKALGKKTNLYAYQPPTVIGQFYDSLVNGIGEFFKKVFGNDTNYTWFGAIGKLLKGLSGTVGLPVYNIWRTAVNTWNLIAPKRIEIDSYDPGEKAEIKYAYLDGYLTEEEASELLMQIVDKDGESMSADDAYWLIREWDGGEDYSRFGGLYEAVLSGKDLEEAMEDLLAHGYTEKDLLSKAKGEIGRAFREGEITRDKAEELLKKHFDMTDEQISSLVNEWRAVVDTDIAYGEIGSSFLSGDITEDRAMEMYMEYGGKTEEDAQAAVNHLRFERDTGYAWGDLESLFVDGTISANDAERYLMEYGGAYRLDAQTTIRQWQCEKDTGIKYRDIRSLYISGDITAQRAQDLRVEYGGASLDDARKAVLKWQCEIDNGVRYEDIGEAFLSGDISRSEAVEWQMTYGEKDEDEADLYITAYEWRNENPEYGDLSDSAIGRYLEHCEPSGVPAALFYEARHFCSDIESDGTRGNVKDQYVQYITSLPVSFNQQTALWLALKNTQWSNSGTPFA